ncbi:LacI family DNA-binding transcriptional regulator [Enterococcus asini]|uniref:LacI family DNA-binding transcriptional regulator n=1 Tax=Enterococcus asini TaxID=57732 RepID=UPI00288E8520|nr:LacI family DNA-binding transcriptional regulator [Enterococcus asini]MDT2757585.1 LacI family DNA-binding transcriptional regulator [Enterococcus asini]
MVTIRDIARLSGFSVTTVSRALNNHDDVSSNTKKIIQSIANREEYAPNMLAKGLVSQDSKTFGFITSNLQETSPMDNFTFLLFMKSLERANILGYDIVMIHYNTEIHKNKTFQQIISERNLTGAILQGFDKSDDLCQEALESDIPTVFIDIGLSNESSGYVVSNIDKAADIGFDFLLNECGYQNMVFVFGSIESWVTSQWQVAVKKAQAKYHRKLKSFDSINGHYKLDLAQEALRNHSDLIYKEKLAFFCASDLMGIGIMRGLKEFNKSVPQDIGILGYDGIDITQYVTPTLSTIRQFPDELGAQTVNLLIEIKNRNQENVSHCLSDIDVKLVRRDSTRRVHSDD